MSSETSSVYKNIKKITYFKEDFINGKLISQAYL